MILIVIMISLVCECISKLLFQLWFKSLSIALNIDFRLDHIELFRLFVL
jgi:hypothetical protein